MKTKKKVGKVSGRDVLNPDGSLLVKLGSIIIHAEEFASPGGHEFDKAAMDALLNDQEVREWIGGMGKLALLPVKRPLPARAKGGRKK